MNYKVIENKLINPEFTVEFDYDISDVKYNKGIYVVLLDIPNDIDEVDNIYGVDEQGKVIWRIENPIKAFSISADERGYDYFANSIYVGIFNVDGVFSANTFFGIKYTFDYKTGKLISKEAKK